MCEQSATMLLVKIPGLLRQRNGAWAHSLHILRKDPSRDADDEKCEKGTQEHADKLQTRVHR